jgi:hypothetical protein
MLGKILYKWQGAVDTLRTCDQTRQAIVVLIYVRKWLIKMSDKLGVKKLINLILFKKIFSVTRYI